MTNRTQEIERSLSALVAFLSEHRTRVADAADNAEQKALAALEHGWDGVAQE
ncbi:hypothetical protein KIH74_28065 [Kineosporia sp. J2-2]|uniref:Uncharacterized protein n=1 Tax=Kineosporia corallincola TaxID=2835133 RepID=A0ABS5TP03_9ACTN|nr:hypothetical protein [Kineosporia corallincola]MBT0772830.1 hypothetical protein [Kineosporia corallincola]